MRNIRRFIVPVLLGIVLCLGLAPSAAFAAEAASTSKSKTATNLDSNYESQVTLSLPSEQENLTSDVVFVVDASSCSSKAGAQAMDMLSYLAAQVESTDATVNVGVIVFRGNTTSYNNGTLTKLDKTTASDLASYCTGIDKHSLDAGSNLDAGLIKAKAMLDGDTTTAAGRKYVVVISDGITYTWDNDGEQYGAAFETDGGPQFASNTAWEEAHGSLGWVPKDSKGNTDWATYLDGSKSRIDATLTTYATPYDRKNIQNPIPHEEKIYDTYADSVTVALYKSRAEFQSMVAEGYVCYSVPVSEADTAYQYGVPFMSYLGTLGAGTTTDFKSIQNDIYYLVGAGTTVTDYMGSGTDNMGNAYNFDFVNSASALSLKVGSTTYQAVDLGNGSYAFGEKNDEGVYPYVLTYEPDNANGEAISLAFNVPVTNFDRVELTYSVKLTNPQTTAGTYGTFSADGSAGATSLYTNNSAVLAPVDSEGKAGATEEFPKPTVSYTVAEPVTPTEPTQPTTDGGSTNQATTTKAKRSLSGVPATGDATPYAVFGGIAALGAAAFLVSRKLRRD